MMVLVCFLLKIPVNYTRCNNLLGGLDGLGRLGLGLDDLLDNLLLLDQESADDSVTDAVSATGTTVGTVDGLLAAGDASVLGGAESGDLNTRIKDMTERNKSVIRYSAQDYSAVMIGKESKS